MGVGCFWNGLLKITKIPFRHGVSIKMGMTGKASLAPYFQNFYHDKVLGLRDVVGIRLCLKGFTSTSM